MFWIIIFSGALGSSGSEMHPTNSVGPFSTEVDCYGAAALVVSELNDKNPDKDFRAACSKSPDIVRHAGQPLYDLRMLAALAGVPFPQDSQ